MEYFPSIDRYIDSFEIYTEDDIAYFDKVKSEWQKTLPDYSFAELVEMFPTAKPVIKAKLEEEIEKYKKDLKRADEVEKEIDDIIYRKCKSKQSEWFWNQVKNILFVNPLRGNREAKIKRNLFRLELLKNPKGKEGRITDTDVEKAKAFPITELVEFGKDHKAGCVWHKEKTASMHYYPKTNRVKCFGCGEFGDPIAVYMALNTKANFIEAVKALSK